MGSKSLRTRRLGSDQDKTGLEDKAADGIKKDRGLGSIWDRGGLCSSRDIEEWEGRSWE